MLLILPYLDVFQNCFDNTHTINGRLAMRILYNPDTKILVSKNYVNHLEQHFPNKEFFQALIKELYDSGRLESKQTENTVDNIDDEFFILSQLPKIPVLIPIIFNSNFQLENRVTFICSKQKVIKLNKHWVQFEIAKNTQCTASHLDFKNDHEIQTYFDDIFSIPRYVRACYIFDRDKTHEKKEKLKGKNVKYYTLFSSEKHFEKKIILADLQKKLGGSLQLFSTNKKTLLHERKIIFENFILTCDNSFCNINSKEPTWEITFYFSPSVAIEWQKKCNQFVQIR